MPYTEKQIQQFWQRVNTDGPTPANHPELGPCWEWTGGRNGQGYGQVRMDYRQISTHKLAWELTYGEVQPGEYVLRKCENPACCNPAHLFLGDAKQNMAAAIAKKGSNFNRGVSRHHLKAAEIEDLKARHANGVTMAQLARDFHVNYKTVANILKSRTRKT